MRHPIAPLFRARLLLAALVTTASILPILRAQEAASDEVFVLAPFNVSAYKVDVRIIDGFTGRDYEGDHPVVIDFARSFNKLLTGFHKKLVLDEVKHLESRIKLGKDFEREMRALVATFGHQPFSLGNSHWLRRERAIIDRLVQEPFFKVDAVVAWDLDRLNATAPKKPRGKFARDIRHDDATGRWERRVLATWEVFFVRSGGNTFATEKTQGLNLDTLRGFHFIEQGLPGDVPPHAFGKVSLTYPIFYTAAGTGAEELRRLQQMLIANLHFIYDPFSWVYRRNIRFRGGFLEDCLAHVEAQRLPVSDREWFDPVFARFLSDLVTIKLEGAGEIYSLHMLNRRVNESPRVLGLGLDLLNWNDGERRTAEQRPESPVRLAPAQPHGFRYVLIDAHQRFGDAFLAHLRAGLLAAAQSGGKTSGRQLFIRAIEELSAQPYDAFVAQAIRTQEAALEQHRPKQPGL